MTLGETDVRAAGGRERADVQELRERLAAATRREAELRELLADAHDQLAERDEELLRSALAHRRVEQMRETRLWRMGERYWRIRDRIRAALKGLAWWR